MPVGSYDDFVPLIRQWKFNQKASFTSETRFNQLRNPLDFDKLFIIDKEGEGEGFDVNKCH